MKPPAQVMRDCRRSAAALAPTTAQIIADFRHMAFDVAYHGLYANVSDNTARFGLAMVASIQPIPDEKMPLVLAWWHWARRKGTKRGMKFLLDEGHEPPAELRAVIDDWRAAMRRKAAFDGEDESLTASATEAEK